MSSAAQKPSLLYWIISAILLVWGVLGLLVYIFYFIQSPEEYAAGVETAEKQAGYAAYVANIPLWAIASGVIAAAARFFGAICLLLRKAWAPALYVISLVFFVIAYFRAFVLSNAGEVMSARHLVIEAVFLALSLFAIWYSYGAKRKGILT
jgi:hypothetical protein